MPHPHLLLALERLQMAGIVGVHLLRCGIIGLRKARQRQRDIPYLPLLWLTIALFMRLVVALQFLVGHLHLCLKLRGSEHHIAHGDLFMVATIRLFDFGVRHVDPLSQQGGNLLEEKILLLFRLELAWCNRGDLATQYRLIAGGAEPTLLLERR